MHVYFCVLARPPVMLVSSLSLPLRLFPDDGLYYIFIAAYLLVFGDFMESFLHGFFFISAALSSWWSLLHLYRCLSFGTPVLALLVSAF